MDCCCFLNQAAVRRNPSLRLVTGAQLICRAVSAIFPGSVFVDYVAEYANPQFTADTLNETRIDYKERLALLGLAENKGEGQK